MTDSSSLTVVVAPAALSLGKITAIRVQDVKEDNWFNYDEGKWDVEPVVTPGAGNLYIAFWVINEGETGDLALYIKDDEGVLATKIFLVPAGEGLGVEWTGDMPNKSYSIIIVVDPGDSMRFTVNPTGWLLPIPLWQIALLGIGAAGAGGAIYYASRRRSK